MGLLVALVARETGANVLVTEVNPAGSPSRENSASMPSTPRVVVVAEHIAAQTGEAGADVVFEVSGSAAGALEMSRLACLRGRIVLVAIFPEPQPVSLFDFFWKELELRGSECTRQTTTNEPIELLEDGRLLSTASSQPSSRSIASGGVRGAVAVLVGDEDPRGLPGVSDAVGPGRSISPDDRAVTGCRRGIGRAAAYALARAGADIAGVSASLEANDEVATEIAELVGASVRTAAIWEKGRRCTSSPRRSRPTSRASTSSSSTRGRSSDGPAVEHGDDLWDRVLEVNLTAQFVLAREPGRRMVAQGSGKIIFVASMLSFQGGVTVPGYAASKGGIAQLTKALANEWASPWRERERRRAGLHRNRQHGGAPGGRDARAADPRADPRGALG